ncbi:hypothetical protein [Thermoflavimicrobium dichotomicum]|uniref:Uncharacterized protein n=1 Tax=Thermoflavimicrobium dichotomicum TaxID=46223 RepID=A0A1I3KFI1_9BACL|nr:hypothetical protein [Thermoflavimicrobium dichotomicum]SFI71217.1 hypothetical protein SAMN05421852_101440 [Thermoflavimicrobium dichotomicum]
MYETPRKTLIKERKGKSRIQEREAVSPAANFSAELTLKKD